MKHLTTFLVVLSTLLYSTIARSQVTPKYNVLFIAVDDMNDRCSFLGNAEVKTPNLQRLVNRGMVFKLAYCQYSICCPSRTSVLSGFRPDKTQVFSNSTRPRSIMGASVKFLPEYFEQFGYHTERYGKIMHGDFENDIAWDYSEPAEKIDGGKGVIAESNANPGGDWWIKNMIDTSSDEDSVVTDHFTTRLRQPQLQPFFYGFGLHTHNPFNPSVRYWNLNGDPSVQELLPINKSGAFGNVSGNGSETIILPQTPLNDRSDIPAIAFQNSPIIKSALEWKKTIHAYDAEVAQMDAYLGSVLDEIDRQDLWANTVVIFWSDHGQHLGEHEGTWLKNTLFEESLHIPLIVCVPGKAAGICNRLVELVDLYPTLAELCGIPIPVDMEGSSFAKLLDDPALVWKKAVFSQVKSNNSIMGRSVRTECYHFNSWGDKGEELYDHDTDPHEYTNLAANPAYSTELNAMKSILSANWQGALPPQYSLLTFYSDADNDGFGNLAAPLKAYSMPAGYVTDSSDCNDTNAAMNPSAIEICGNGIDDNCNGQIDENSPKAIIKPMGNTDICTVRSVDLKANDGTGYNYQWMKNGIDVVGEVKRRYTARTTGIYNVIATFRGCRTISNSETVLNSCSLVRSINEISFVDIDPSKRQLSIYPNPSKGKMTVQFNSNYTNNVKLRIFDLMGRLVLSKIVQQAKGENTFSLNLPGLVSGAYFLELDNGYQQNRARFIIAR